MTDFTMDKGADGVAVITWDLPGKSMNVLTMDGAQELSDLVDDALADEAVKGIVITSGKETMAGGMDLNVLAGMKTGGAEAVFEGVMTLHQLFRKIERAGMEPKTNKGGKPIAAAVPGTAMGIGLELPLACHRIFVADNPKAKLGLPEIQVGIFPGAGGTTRLVRKLGVMMAAPYLLQAKMSDPKAAQKAGIVDEVVADPVAAAKEWVLSEPKFVKPWDEKGYKLPGGAPYHPAGFQTFVGANAMINGETWGAFPAPKALLSAVYEGAQVPFDTALKIEARWFTSVIMNPSSSAMIRSLFLNKEALEKGANRPEAPDQRVKKLGVMGAGMMGAGIALVSAQAGIEVVLIDQKQEAADKGKAYTEAFLDKGIKRGKTTPAEFNEKCGVLLQGRTSSMLGYPEGTRHTEDAPTRPLKTGMLRMAFKMGVCIQLVITAGKGEILQEKRLRVRYGCAVTTFGSPVFDPKTMSEDEFLKAVQEAWAPTYEAAVAAHKKLQSQHEKSA